MCSCSVDGVYDAWSVWSLCDASCDGGIRLRSRSCIGQSHGGNSCVGPDHETETCNHQNCPGKHILYRLVSSDFKDASIARSVAVLTIW